MRIPRAVLVIVALALAWFLTITLAGCGMRTAGVPVVTADQNRPGLAGVWEGKYQLADENRAGTIYFALQQGRDTANGYVVMSFEMPMANAPTRMYPAPPLRSEQLAISFVRIGDGSVTGELERYVDPYCACRLVTTFTGRVRGDRIGGSFTTSYVDTDAIVRGTWSATRRSLKLVY